MAQPNRARFGELPIASVTFWDRKQQVDGVLTNLEYGQFYNAALLCDAMMRDATIHNTTSSRLNGLLGTPLDFPAARDTAMGRKVAEATKRYWPVMFPTANLAELHRWGLLLSLGVGELCWTMLDGYWIPRLKPWHPSACMWDWKEKGYWLNTVDGRIFLPRTDEQPHGDGKWVVHTPFGFRGFLRALVRALAEPYLGLGWGTRDWSRSNEVHGFPIRLLKVPQDANEDDKDDFFAQASALGSESVLELPFNAEGGFGMDLLEAKADISETFAKYLGYFSSLVQALVLGHAQASSGEGGNVYGAMAGMEVRADLIEFDATTITGTLVDQVLYWFTKFNFGGELATRPVYQTTPPASDQAAAQALQALGQAAAPLVAAKAPVDWRALLARFNVPLLDVDAPLQLEPPAPKPAPAPSPAAPGAPNADDK